MVVLLGAVQIARAQESTNSGIVGRVLDSSGAAVPGAKVIAINTGTNAERRVVTNEQGEFSIPSLPPANYRLRIGKEGFATTLVPAFDLLVGTIAREQVNLKIGSVDTTVEVSAQAPILEADSATIDQVFQEKQIVDLPLNGRSVMQLAGLSAGVIQPALTQVQQGATSGNQYGDGPSRNERIQTGGGRDSSTNYVIDGVYARSLRFNNMSVQPSVDMIQEFNLIQNAASAEYGQGQSDVTMITKSGSNRIHGTAYEFMRNDAFGNAKYYFAGPGVSNPLHQNQFGATTGAPIIKDKIFVFGGYEGYRQSKGMPLYYNVPDPAQLRGDFTHAATCPTDPFTRKAFGFPGPCIVPSAEISQYSKIMTPTIPAPNGSYLGGGFNYLDSTTITNNRDTVTFRSDQVLSQKHTLFERYIWYNSTQLTPGLQAASIPQSGQNISVGDTYVVKPKITNEVRLGWNYANSFFQQVPPGTENYSADMGLQNVQATTNLQERGRPYTPFIGYSTEGEGAITQGAKENYLSINDTVSVTFGRHTIRAGIQLQDRRFIQLTDVTPRGAFAFYGYGTGGPSPTNAIADYVIGFCIQCVNQIGGSNGHYTDHVIAPFVVDTWQVNPRLTVNLGLRYEYDSPWHEQNNLEGSFDPASQKISFHVVPTNIPANLAPIINMTPLYPAGIVSPVRDNFGPRVGFAYRINDKTVVRSGFGLFFDNTNLNELQFSRHVAPYTLNYTGQAKFTAGQFPGATTATAPYPASFSLNPKNRYPYSEQWNLSIQQEFAKNWILELAYTGSASHKLWKRYDQNEPLLNPNTGGIIGSTPQGPYPNFQTGILTTTNAANASFEALSAKVEKRFSKGLFLLGNIQWAKNIDDGTDDAFGNNTAYSQYFAKDRGLSGYDTRFRSANTVSYELPFGVGKTWLNRSGLTNTLFGGWQVNTIVAFISGFALTPTASGCACLGSYTPYRVNLAPGAINYGNLGKKANAAKWFDKTAFVAPQYQGLVGRGVIHGPGIANVDFSTLKNFKLGDGFTLQFRGEFFNAINHPNLGAPDLNIQDASAGVISTASDARITQLALKLIW